MSDMSISIMFEHLSFQITNELERGVKTVKYFNKFLPESDYLFKCVIREEVIRF